jgi:O-antigen/teichoic acid export membrane protein
VQINKIDVLWNFGATFFRIASSVILLPLILKYLPAQEVGIWAIFSSISALVFLLDFGFHSSFVRNVTYVFSGVQSLEKKGLNINNNFSEKINYTLLKGILGAMKWFYSRIALLVLLLLLTIGSIYIQIILKGYSGNITNIIIAWILFCIINTYNLYTLYYDALLEGKGLIRVSKKISLVANGFYLIIASLLVFNGFGLIAIVLSQLFSIVIIRVLSYKFFFTEELLLELNKITDSSYKEVLKIVSPNAYKYGVTSLGGFMIQKSSIFIGSLFIPLVSIASFGITKQLLDVLVALANITLATYIPKITKLRVDNNLQKIKEIYIKGILISNFIYLTGALFIIFFGQFILSLIRSKTELLSIDVLVTMALSSLIGLNAGISGIVIATKNEIPFMKPSIYSGIATVILLLTIFYFTNLGLLGMALVPGFVDLCYQGWKWPYEVIKELKIKKHDVITIIKEYITNNDK